MMKISKSDIFLQIERQKSTADVEFHTEIFELISPILVVNINMQTSLGT